MMTTVDTQQSGSQSQRSAEGTLVYRLGRVSFTVTSADTELEHALPKLLKQCQPHAEKIHHLHADNLRTLLTKVLELHEGYLWISAACLQSPQGHKVLISGHSSAGKSTTALALALSHGWKVLAEDIVGIDERTNKVLVIATPFSLKKGTLELLQATIDRQPEPLLLGEWVPLSSMHAEQECDADFDLILFFGPAKQGESLQKIECSPGEYVRLLLPCSNLLHDYERPEKFAQYMKSGRCYRVLGGGLWDRMQLILDMTTGNRP